MPSRSVAPSLTITSRAALPDRLHRHARSRPHGQRRPHRETDVARPRLFDRVGHVGRDQRLSEADRRGLEQPTADLTVRILIAFTHAVEHDRYGHAPLAAETDGRGRGAVELDDVHRARLLVETVDILGDHHRGEPRLLESGDGEVSLIRLGVREAPLQARLPALDAHRTIAHIALDRVALRVGGLPDAVRPAEVGDPGLGRDARAGEHKDPPGVPQPRQR